MKNTPPTGLVCLFVIALLPINAIGQTVIVEPDSLPEELIRERRIRPPSPRMPRGLYLEMKKHLINATITDGVAQVDVEQVFHNPYKHTIEGKYIMPLADDAAIGKFSMFINGEEVQGRVLEAKEARRVYESIVRKMKDPALLEHVGKRMFQASIFPINADSDVKVKLAYTQMLNADNGLVAFTYPLNTEKYNSKPIETLGIVIHVESKQVVKSVFSSSHKLAVAQPGDHKVSASYEGNGIAPNRDFSLYYALSDKEFGLTLLTYRDGQSEEDGYFLARISPPRTNKEEGVLPKDICFVLDTSGSMSGEKIEQAKSALKYCVSNLSESDRFNIISFCHRVSIFKEKNIGASKEMVKEAREFVDALDAEGGTNIHDALVQAVESAPTEEEKRPYMTVFLTDGMPTVGVTDAQEIINTIAQKCNKKLRLFAFGVGYDVNTILLDTLAQKNRGTREYVQPGENLELKLSSFYNKMSRPVLTDLKLDFGGLNVSDVYPADFGDLFAGTELVVTGRYKGSGSAAVTLKGMQHGVEKHFVYENTFAADNKAYEFLPRLWAIRKVGYLLDQIRLNGEQEELREAVVKLATRYAIVTPYTSFLVTEPNQEHHFLRLARPKSRGRARGGRVGVALPPQRQATPATGESAVKGSVARKKMQTADAMAAFETDNFSEAVVHKPQLVGVRTFRFTDGKWVDSQFDGKKETKKVLLYSAEYFELVAKHKELAKCFALGDHVIVVLDDTVYETIPPQDEDKDGND